MNILDFSISVIILKARVRETEREKVVEKNVLNRFNDLVHFKRAQVILTNHLIKEQY